MICSRSVLTKGITPQAWVLFLEIVDFSAMPGNQPTPGIRPRETTRDMARKVKCRPISFQTFPIPFDPPPGPCTDGGPQFWSPTLPAITEFLLKALIDRGKTAALVESMGLLNPVVATGNLDTGAAGLHCQFVDRLQ
nr:hypothetical protein [Luteolibacter marinus]